MKNKRMWIYGTLVILLAATCFGAGLLDKNDQNMFGKWFFYAQTWMKGLTPLVFEGAVENAYETTIALTEPTADRTVTFQNATGTVVLRDSTDTLSSKTLASPTITGDATITADSTGGNAGAKSEFIGLPRIKLVGGGQGTNPDSQTIALLDDSPNGEFAPVDATVTEALDEVYYKYDTASYKALFLATAVAGSGFVDAGLGAAAAWDDMESVGMLVRSSEALTAGDLTLVLTDDGGARTYNIPAVASADTWTWVEVNIATGDLSAVSDVAVLLSTAGAAAHGAFNFWVDIAYVWDAADEEALGVAIQQDGVLGVINTESGAQLAELTDYLVHYETGSDFIVYITDQSTADIAALVAY